MNVVGWLGLIATLIAVLTALTVGYVIIRSKVKTTTSELWQEEAQALRARLVTVEEDSTKKDAEISELKTRVEAQDKTIEVLKTTVTGAPEIARLAADTAAYQTASLALLERIYDILTETAPASRRAPVKKAAPKKRAPSGR